MALHAIEDIGDAFTATREFLLPFELRRWLKLAFVVLFVGSGMSLPTVQFDASSGVDQPTGGELPTVSPDDWLLIGGIVGTIILLALLFALVGAIMEFVFVESLRTREVTVRRYWSRRWRQGLRLFGFRLVIGLPVVGVVVGWMALLFVPIVYRGIDPIATFGMLFFLGIPFLFLISLLYALVASFTTAFVVPIMIKTDGGVLAGWRLLWGSIKAEPKQYFVYAVIVFVLSIAAGIAASLAVGLAAIGLVIPVAILGVLLSVTVSFSSTIVTVAFVGVVLLFVLALFVLWLLVQVPVVAYLRYYALFVLGDVDASLDLIPDQRADVRRRRETRSNAE
ncbi:MAG: DUF7544 domain-containing protein [Halobacteriota archaeon]|uniref:DUF7544 domain-containing protein n=1 Tax=Natronomonas sp. TaxID=2184060 RepID=UPI0039767952